MNRLVQILILYSIANPATIARSETTAFVRPLKPAVSNRNQLTVANVTNILRTHTS